MKCKIPLGIKLNINTILVLYKLMLYLIFHRKLKESIPQPIVNNTTNEKNRKRKTKPNFKLIEYTFPDYVVDEFNSRK